jgi:drug/metabolite transporter (DMT)-like permease
MLNAFWIILGAALWATDTVFRHPMIQQMTPVTIVFFEHAFAALLGSLPVIWLATQNPKRGLATLFKMKERQWGALLMIGVLGSCLATIFFTASFQFINPTVAILLQKIQPILVISWSYLFLGERPRRPFWVWAMVAMVAAFWMSFPEGISKSDLAFSTEEGDFRGTGFALAAAGLWAASTVVGKSLLKEIQPTVVTFWRFFFGFAGAALLVYLSPQARLELPFVTADSAILKSLFAMALLSGFLGVGIYYKGLSKVPASIATVLELAFPLAAMWINATFLDLHLSDTQLISAAALSAAMLGVSRSQARSLYVKPLKS